MNCLTWNTRHGFNPDVNTHTGKHIHLYIHTKGTSKNQAHAAGIDVHGLKIERYMHAYQPESTMCLIHDHLNNK